MSSSRKCWEFFGIDYGSWWIVFGRLACVTGEMFHAPAFKVGCSAGIKRARFQTKDIEPC